MKNLIALFSLCLSVLAQGTPLRSLEVPPGTIDGQVLTYYGPANTWYPKTASGGSGSLTPWASDINAAGFALTNLNYVSGVSTSSNALTVVYSGTYTAQSETNGDFYIGGKYNGNGSLLTSLSATSLGSGTVPSARLSTLFSGYPISDTSAHLATWLTDPTGSGAAVFATTPTIVTPTIASFVNANHNHQNSAGGGTLDGAAIASGSVVDARLGWVGNSKGYPLTNTSGVIITSSSSVAGSAVVPSFGITNTSGGSFANGMFFTQGAIGTAIELSLAGASAWAINNAQEFHPNNMNIGWQSSSPINDGANNDTYLERTAAGVVRVNNSVNLKGWSGHIMTSVAPTAGAIGGTVGSITNHVMQNVNGVLIDYWSDGTTLWSKQLAP